MKALDLNKEEIEEMLELIEEKFGKVMGPTPCRQEDCAICTSPTTIRLASIKRKLEEALK